MGAACRPWHAPVQARARGAGVEKENAMCKPFAYSVIFLGWLFRCKVRVFSLRVSTCSVNPASCQTGFYAVV